MTYAAGYNCLPVIHTGEVVEYGVGYGWLMVVGEFHEFDRRG